MVRITREQCLCALIPPACHMHLRDLPIRAQDQLCEGHDGETAPPRRSIPDLQPLDTNRILSTGVHRHECEKYLFQSMTVMLAFRVSLSMTRPISVQFPHRQWRGCPKDAAVLVPNIDRVRRTV